jgi:hypothetical protein
MCRSVVKQRGIKRHMPAATSHCFSSSFLCGACQAAGEMAYGEGGDVKARREGGFSSHLAQACLLVSARRPGNRLWKWRWWSSSSCLLSGGTCGLVAVCLGGCSEVLRGRRFSGETPHASTQPRPFCIPISWHQRAMHPPVLHHRPHTFSLHPHTHQQAGGGKIGGAQRPKEGASRGTAVSKKPEASALTPWTKLHAPHPHPHTHKHHARQRLSGYRHGGCAGGRASPSSAAFTEPPHGTPGLSSLPPPPPLPLFTSSFFSPPLIRADDTQLHTGHGRGDEADEFVYRDQ